MKHTLFPKAMTAAAFVATTLIMSAQQLVSDNVPTSGLPTRSLVDVQQDSLINNHKIIYIDGRPDSTTQGHNDSIRKVMETFYYDQFHSFDDPAAPYFMFMSRDASLAMGVGGCVRIRGWYDWGGAIPANGFSPYLIQMNDIPGNNRKLGATPAGSTLFFRVLGRNKSVGDYQLYIEANFNGYEGADFHLKKAYAIIRNLTIGYAPSTFSDPAAVPPTVDASGPNNKISGTNILVRWMKTYKTRWTVAGSLELPKTAVAESDGYVKKANNWLPEPAVFLQYAWGKSEHVRLAGVLRDLPYADLRNNKTYNKLGWGLQLSTIAHPVYPLTLYGTINCGEGHESTTGDLAIGNYDLVQNPHDPYNMYAPFSLGWNVGVQYNLLPNLFASVSYSDTRYMPRSPRETNEYKYGNTWMANIFWNPTPRIQAGIEFDTGIRKNWGGDHRRAQRIGAMAQFSF